ncbi:monoacylglycerol lipase ABHD2-like [Mizuhopecten yessoensis]|nr:monoacylglycerol lipase ABHD2-like [Mizuhopecten yessoensis]
MMEIWSFLGILLLYAIFRLLHWSSMPTAPTLYWQEGSKFVQDIISSCPFLTEPYIPPHWWGKSGHIQTIVYAKLGRVSSPFPKGERHHVVLPDGATIIYDVFQPHRAHESGGDYTITVCPGIANSSEASYICTFVNYAQENGYRVTVLNHIGAIRSVKITSSRIFTYGGTEEFHTMIQEVRQMYPGTNLIACGFSMGANIVVKYLGEKPKNQQQFLCALSICQGYDVNHATSLLQDWRYLRRVYLYAMTANQKGMMTRHQDILMDQKLLQTCDIDAEKIYSSTSLIEIDELYTRRRLGFESLQEYYSWCSCQPFMHDIEIPLFLLNAEDDPIIPMPLVDVAKDYAIKHDKSLLAVTKHGGHLGYFEGQGLWADPITWLDRSIIQYANAIVAFHIRGKL